MANWSVLKAAIADIIKTNGNQAITGQLLQNALNNIVTCVGENATFAGIATPSTNPGAPDGPIFYLATTSGNYVNFNGITINAGEAVILQWNNGSWYKKTAGFATQEKQFQLKYSKQVCSWLDKLGGANLNTSNEYGDLYTQVIKDIWFEFPNGIPSWWGSRQPQLRAINGSDYFDSTTGKPSPYRLRFFFRASQNEEYSDEFTFDITGWEYKGQVEHRRFLCPSISNQPTFYVNVVLDTAPLMGITKTILSSSVSSAIQPMIIKKTTSSFKALTQIATISTYEAGKPISFNSKTKILTFPEGVMIGLGQNSYPRLSEKQELNLNIETSDGKSRQCVHIIFDVNEGKFKIVTLNTVDSILGAGVYGGDIVLVGVYNLRLNKLYLYSGDWEVDGFPRDINYIGNLRMVKTILASSPLLYNPETWEITVPKDTRIIRTDGSRLYLNPGVYKIHNGEDNGFYDVFINNEGNIISVYFTEDKTRYFAEMFWIGWVHTTNALVQNYYFTGLEDGSFEVVNVKLDKENLNITSNWLESYNYNQILGPKLMAAKKAIKDIWFEFPEGIVPDWFNERKPMLRSISNTSVIETTTNFPIRIYFFKDDEEGYGDTGEDITTPSVYCLDLARGTKLGSDGAELVRIESTIEGTKIIANIIINENELYGEGLASDKGLILSSGDCLKLKPFIYKKLNSIYSKEALSFGYGVKTILNNNGTYISYDSKNGTIDIPSNTRFINYRGDIIRITEGLYVLSNKSGTSAGYFNIFVEISTGTLIGIYYSELNLYENRKYWNTSLYVWIGWVHGQLGTAYFIASNYKVDNKLCGEKEGLDDVGIIVPQIYNTQIRRVDISKPLRIVCFGSSWFMNTWWYLNKIIKSAGINAELTCFYTGGAYFSQWVERYNNNASVDCWKSSNGSDWVKTTSNFKDTLNESWDIIGFQQGAYAAIEWENRWKDHWSELASIVKRSCGVDTIIAFNSTWTPPIDGNLSPYPNSVEGQKLWQTDNYNNVRRFMGLSGINNVSPNGATIWAMRRNESLNLLEDLATDSLHPDNGLPMYALAGTFFETFIAPMYGISFDSVDWMPDSTTQKAPVSGSNYQSISAEQRELVRKIIKLALSDRFGFREL